jgi:hypothetical protein
LALQISEKAPGIRLAIKDAKIWWKIMVPKHYLYLLIVLLNLALCEAAVVEINLNYDTQTDKFSFNSSRLLDIALPGGIRADSDYKWILYSANDAILNRGNITIPGPIIVERDIVRNISAQVIYPDNQIISIYLNYNPRLRNLIVHDLSDELLNIDLMQYNRCNLNSLCDPNENRLLCPEDCPDSAKDGICHNIEDGICQQDPDCPNSDPDCVIQENRQVPQEIKNNTAEKPYSDNKSVTQKKPVKSGFSSSIIIPLLVIAIILFLSAIAFYIIQMRKNQQ